MPEKYSHTGLVEGCKRGDSHAQRCLYDRFAPAMLAVCHRYARKHDDALDMLQEAFIKVFQNISRYDDRGSLEGWIRRIVVNTAIDHLRKHKHQLLEQDASEAVHLSAHTENALDHLELETLLKVVQSLPDGYRMIFNLYAIEGFSHAEIGEQLGITESTSRSQYTRARGLLRKRIEQVYMEEKVYKDVV